MDRRIERGESTRKRLLVVAGELFTERGYEDTPLELVIDRAAISKGALYHHFANKRELYEAVLEDAEARLANAIVLAARGEHDPVEALHAGGRALLRQARDPAIARIVLTDAPAVLGWERWREIDERHSFGILKAGLARTPAAKRLTPRALDTLAHVLLAALIELAMLVARAKKPRAAQRDAQIVLAELLDRLLR
jgi:AcrR family transcriptional regulator